MTSKYGFSVVAPISVTSPSSTAGSSASCWALLKRWISSRKRIVRGPCGPSRSRARPSTSRTCATVADTAESSSNAAPVDVRDDPRQRRLRRSRAARRGSSTGRGPRAIASAAPSPRRARAAGRRTRRASRPEPQRERRDLRQPQPRPRLRRGRPSARKYAPRDGDGDARGLLGADSPRPRRAATTSATCAPTTCSRCRRRRGAGAPRRAALPDRPPVLGALAEARAGSRSSGDAACRRAASSPRRCACCAARSTA